MTRSTKKANAFLAAMQDAAPDAPPDTASRTRDPDKKLKAQGGRAGLKHIGGYLDRQTVERVAILRARLGLDNSELIRVAIDDLYRRHETKRTFGDA